MAVQEIWFWGSDDPRFHNSSEGLGIVASLEKRGCSCWGGLMTRLTLNIDYAVLTRARRWAKSRGVSLTKLVAAYLATLGDSRTPILDSVRGILKKGDVEDYRRYLA